MTGRFANCFYQAESSPGVAQFVAVKAKRMIDDPDRQIAAGLQEGKSEAWSALYQAYFDRVWRLAGRMIGPDASAVADVVQETFLSAARSVRTFDPSRGPLWLWLAGICRNQVAAYFRTRRRADRVKAGGDLHEAMLGPWARRLQQDQPQPHEATVSAEEAALVRLTLANLPSEYQLLLTSRYFEDVPVDEIAKDIRCSVVAVRSKLARARRAFREAFSKKLGRKPSAPAVEGEVGSPP
jgi:RNA polymerase sigma-70 factor (ECF subfamily)